MLLKYSYCIEDWQVKQVDHTIRLYNYFLSFEKIWDNKEDAVYDSL